MPVFNVEEFLNSDINYCDLSCLTKDKLMQICTYFGITVRTNVLKHDLVSKVFTKLVAESILVEDGEDDVVEWTNGSGKGLPVGKVSLSSDQLLELKRFEIESCLKLEPERIKPEADEHEQERDFKLEE